LECGCLAPLWYSIETLQVESLWMNSTIQNETAATKAAAGIVRIHAQTIRPATPHFTADNLRVAPTPTIDPVIV